MKPLHHAAVTQVLNAPADWDQSKAECTGLPIIEQELDGLPCLTSVWQPSDEERRAIAMGAPVLLHVISAVHPPVMVEVL